MISIADVENAAARLYPVRILTPLLEFPLINETLGGRVLFKAENLQRTGSFKFRGAFNKIASLSKEERSRGVVAFSSGNHAQGVAASATHFGIRSTIIMPDDAPEIKKINTRRFGGEVILYDRWKGDRKAIAEELVSRTGAILVPPYDDEKIIAGQGTVGLEVADQLHEMGIDSADFLLCPAGGGGLIAGVSTAMKARSPGTALYSAEPKGFDDTARSLKGGKRVGNESGADTICDAIVTQMPGELTFPINLANLSGGFSASDSDVMDAMDMLFTYGKLVVEPGGAVGLAALLSNQLSLQGRVAVVILSGGNVDLDAFRRRFA